MLWIYLIVGVLSLLISGFLFDYLLSDKKKMAIGAITITLLALISTYYYLNFNQFSLQKKLEVVQIQEESNDFFALVKTHSPQDYDAYLSKEKRNLTQKGDPVYSIYYLEELISTLLNRYSQTASAESLFTYLSTTLEWDKQIFAVDPLLVLIHEFPTRFGLGIYTKKIKEIGPQLYQEQLINMAEPVIASGMQKETLPLTDDQIKQAEMIFKTIIKDLSVVYGENTVVVSLQQPDNPAVDQKKAAEILIAFYDKLLAQGQEQAALVLKALFEQGAKNKPAEKSQTKKASSNIEKASQKTT